MDRLVSVLAPLARVTQPRVTGIDRIPDGPALYVGNHTRWAFLDLPFMMRELWQRRQIIVRGLGDHGHYAIPVWRDLLTLSGMVRGTRENVRALMADGQNVLVFPGGAGEVFKGRGQDYQLIWKERLGFARLAIEFGYPIIPFAAVGAEEMLSVVVDNQMPVAAQISSVMRRLVGVPLPPIPRGIGPTLVPRPERLYFWFGDPIDTAAYHGEPTDEAARTVRDATRAAVDHGVDTLLAEREHDPNRTLLPRLRREEQDLPQPDAADPAAWLVTRAFEAWNETGPAGAAAWMSRSVRLTDPPGWPSAGTWRGREATIARLEEVAGQLSVATVEVSAARGVGANVLVEFIVHRDDDSAQASFYALCAIERDQISRIRVFLDNTSAQNAIGAGTPA